MTASVTQQILN
jgi:hypothetical protein